MLFKLFKVVLFGRKTTGVIFKKFPIKDRIDIVEKSTFLTLGSKQYKVSIEYVEE